MYGVCVVCCFSRWSCSSVPPRVVYMTMGQSYIDTPVPAKKPLRFSANMNHGNQSRTKIWPKQSEARRNRVHFWWDILHSLEEMQYTNHVWDRELGKLTLQPMFSLLTMGSLHLCHVANTILTHLPPSATYMRQWIGSALVQIMACRLFGAKPLS